jgi:3,4-dihydroxy 2-butanone 4-phosphate synthase/GTP cyclohydrolase II
MGKVDPKKPILVRAHREYLPGDVFGYSLRNTRNLLRSAMERISAAGEGVLLYLKRESNALASDFDGGRTPRRATTRANTPEADFRDYGIGAQILRDVGVRKMIIMSDATPRLANLPGYGLEIVGSVPLSTNGKHSAAAK